MVVIRHCFSHLIIQTLYIGTKLSYLSIISKNKNPICACECVHVLKVNFVNVLPLFCCIFYILLQAIGGGDPKRNQSGSHITSNCPRSRLWGHHRSRTGRHIAHLPPKHINKNAYHIINKC